MPPEVIDQQQVPTGAVAPMPAAQSNVAPVTAEPVDNVNAPAVKREDSAIANRDVNGLIQVAKDTIGTPASKAAMESADLIKRESEKFGSLVQPIDKKGGIATPEGRLAFSEQFQTIKDHPQWGNALIAYVMGDKKSAYLQVTGGNIKSQITYDNNGDQILEKVNELGEPVSYTDRKTGKPITEAEYAKRVGGISAWDNTLKGQFEKETRKQSQEALIKDERAANEFYQVTQAHKQFHAENLDTLNKLKSDIPAPLYNKIIGSVSQSLGQANASSNGKSVFNQMNNAFSRGESVTVTDQMASTLGVKPGTVLALDASGKNIVNKDNSIKINVDKLRSQTDTENINKEATQNASQTMASIAEAERLGQLDPIAAQRLRRVIENSQNMGREMATVVDTYGKPSFISLPTSASFVDKQAQVMAQSLQGMQNADQMEGYIQFRRNALEGHKETNTVPLPGEIGANYVKQGVSKGIRSAYAGAIDEVMSKEYEGRKGAPAAEKKSNAAVPPSKTPVAKPSEAAKPPKERPSLADLKKLHGGQ